MRIVAGLYRGRILAAPAGLGTRPTGDRTRQAVFNILEHAAWMPPLEGALVLDAFAGTGAMGLEALSRGAAHAVFIERDRAAAEACRENIGTLGVAARAELQTGDAARPVLRPAHVLPRTLAFLDPPYGLGLGAAALRALAEKRWFAPGAVCVLEMAKKQPEAAPEGFRLLDERIYGIALVRFLSWPGTTG
jgi:16S rRNA (guanine966-N2)-methyltransferase